MSRIYLEEVSRIKITAVIVADVRAKNRIQDLLDTKHECYVIHRDIQ